MGIRCRTTSGAALLSAAFLLAGAGCERSDAPEVVLYVSADEHLAREVAAAFEEQTGIRVKFVGDTEATKTTGLVERLRSEQDHPQADVFWSSEIFMTIELADEGVFEPHESEAVRDWPDAYRDPERRWHAFAARARVIVLAPSRVPESERPATWMDLTQPRWRGRIVMADPRFGTTGGHVGAMKAYWDREFGPGIYEAFLLGLAENDVRLLPSGNAGVVRAVIAGEADLGLTDTDDVWAGLEQGAELDLIYARHSTETEPGTGTLLIPNTVARVRTGPNPAHAGRLVDFLLSEQVERLLAESTSHNLPVRPGLALSYADYAVPDPLDIDYRRAAAERAEAVEAAMRILRDREEPTDDEG